MASPATSVAETSIARPKRWDEPFGAMTAHQVARLLQVEPFRSIDPARFPPNLPLAGIVRYDMRIAEFEAGDLIVREGDYGNSAFMLLHGTARVAVERLASHLIGQADAPRPGWWKALLQLRGNREIPERRNLPPAELPATRGVGRDARVFLQDVPGVLESTQTLTIKAGEFFGELAALSRTQRTATVFAEESAVLLEIRWQGLRELMRRSTAIRDHIDRLYRANSLNAHLHETPLLSHLSDQQLARVAAATQFAAYGSFDWHLEMPQIEKLSPLERIAREPMIAEEGTPIDAVLLIRSGFARLSHRYGEGHRTLAYLGKGQAFGLEELVRDDSPNPSYEYSLRAVGYVDALKIDPRVLRPLLQPQAGKAAVPYVLPPGLPAEQREPLPSALLDFLVDERLINGTHAMVIDLDRCTRCDDCVRACAATHDGNPRFVREGPRFGRFQFAGACMHCVDPVCMIGCPTGAIHRDRETGIVRINDNTCIGCGTCAESCPYTNIQLVQIRDNRGNPVIDQQDQLPILRATKCDFCSEQIIGPACQHACAHDALVRMDVSNLSALAEWMDR